MLRRWRGAWPRRLRWFEPPWPQVTPAAPEWSPAFLRQTLRRLLPIRRGSFHEPVWPASTWPPEFTTQAARRAALARRGRFHAVPPAPVVAAAPSAVPTRWRARSRWLPSRRGRFYGPTWEPVVYGTGLALGVGSAGRPGRFAALQRRGVFHEPPWIIVAAQPSVWRPQPIRATLRLAGRPVRRGQHFEPPWPQAVPPAPSWIPPFRAANPASRSRLLLSRRGEYLWTPPRPAGVPAWLRTRPRSVPSLRARRRFHEPRWVEGPQTVWRPLFKGQAGPRPRFAAKLRRMRWFEPGWPQAQQFIGTPPRWVEEAGSGSGLAEGGGGGVALLEGSGSGTGLAEGGAGSSGLAEGGGGGAGLVEGSGGV